MTYLDSAKGITITKARAIKELAAHGIYDLSEFFADCGNNDTYQAQAVLFWLGY